MTIKKLRIEKNLPLRKVAAALDIDPSTLSKIERGERAPSPTNIKDLSTIFSVDYNDLITAHISDVIAEELVDVENFDALLEIAKLKVKKIRSHSSVQGKLKI